MSVRDEGKTHFYGDDCPGGHRAANVAGVDWDDQETAGEANEREVADLALAARDKHVFANITTCVCGFKPPMSSDWERHRMEAALAAVVPLLRAQLEADVLREAAEAYAKHWRSAAGVGRAVNLPSTQAGFVAWLENRAAENERATALEQAQPLPVAAISEAAECVPAWGVPAALGRGPELVRPRGLLLRCLRILLIPAQPNTDVRPGSPLPR